MAFFADVASIVGSTFRAANTIIGPPTAPRVPIVWHSVLRRRRDVSPLQMQINPNQVQFRQAKRTQKQDTIGGATYFHFTNEKGQNNDILQIQLTGTTGNIDPRALQKQIEISRDSLKGQSTASGSGEHSEFGPLDMTLDRTGARDKLLAWLSFYQLTMEPILDLEGGVINHVDMAYTSALFPKQILLQGFFGTVIQFSELGTEPFQRQWSVPFTVEKTEPPLDEIVDYMVNHMVDQTALNRLRNFLL